ncbi:hypothetical protein GOP47_0005373 [Adiantum capillus-veneris]|uniref:Uncharacterized protein n=1 Tax=Adiantum capillus-veneris TaxID=13818 RepID=A0A9D4V5F4_ADICA|nr:hypothetical protein GOP47_0005373 [Adiantum capillus-veneris]
MTFIWKNGHVQSFSTGEVVCSCPSRESLVSIEVIAEEWCSDFHQTAYLSDFVLARALQSFKRVLIEWNRITSLSIQMNLERAICTFDVRG